MAENATMIYRVAFVEPPFSDSEETDFYFSSLRAIYELFTPEQIGCRVTNLWLVGVRKGETYRNKLCEITRHPLYRMLKNNAKKKNGGE